MELQQQRLAFEEAEGSYAEREATLYNALRACPRGKVDRNVVAFVLRIFAATAGCLNADGVTLSYEEIADHTPQGLWCSVETAKRVVKRCCDLGLVVFSQDRQFGRQAGNRYWIGVVAVLRLAGGMCRNTELHSDTQKTQNDTQKKQNDTLDAEPQLSMQAAYRQQLANKERQISPSQPTGGISRASQCTNEIQEHLLPKYQRPKTLEFGTDVGAMAAAVMAAADVTCDASADPAAQKRRLASRIESIVNDPTMGDYVARAAADLVLLHEVPLAEIDHILGDVEALRGAGNLLSAGAFFHSKVRTLAARLGKPWPKGKGNFQPPA